MAYKNDRTKNRRRYKSRYRSAHSYKQKRSSSQQKAGILVSVATFLVIATLVITFTFGDSIYNVLDNTLSNITATEPVTQPPTEKPTEKPTQPPTEAPTTPPVQQEEQFMMLLENCSLEMKHIKVDQMMFVDADESTLTCQIYCYDRGEDGVFRQNIGPFSGYIGEQGIDKTVTPYESKTPTGLFKIEYTFGTMPDPGIMFEYSQFNDSDYWITDPSSESYNRWVNGYEWAGTSSQWLFEFSRSYPYAIVFDYNRDPVDPAQGCAKFIHVSDGPTSWGGVGVSQNDILSILYWLNPYSKPYVAISK